MIFVHSSFRTSSTFLWSKIRANPGATAYYEVFHETLASLSPELIKSSTVKSWYSKHPDGAPYFLEYLSLLDEKNRVAGFDPSISYERFFPPQGPSGAISEVEASYVRGLIEHTEARGQIPVLTATRSIGRVAGLKGAVPGLHVLLYRNLFQQWCSYTEQSYRVGNYFLDRTLDIVRLSQHDSVIREITALFPTIAASARDNNNFYQFVLLHLYCYAHAAAAADLVLDINRVAVDRCYRYDVEEVFGGQNIQIDLSQARQSMAFSLIDFPSATEMRDFVTITARTIIGSAPNEAGRRFATRVLSDLLEEHDRHEFHAKAMRSALGHAVDAGEAARAEADLLRSQHEGLRNERDAALDLATESHRTCEAALLENEAARSAIDAIRNARNTALTEHDTSVLALQAAEAERNVLVAEADVLRRACVVAEAERNAAQAERDATKAERDAASAEAETARHAQAVAEAGRNAEAEARQIAEASRDAALAEAETARHAQAAAETDRNAEAQARQTAEASRDAALAEAETARHAQAAAETDRNAEAQARQTAEASRDAALAKAETARHAQAAAETERNVEAQARQTAEAFRDAALAEAETARHAQAASETDRNAQAQARQTAEASRDAALAEAETARHAQAAAETDRNAEAEARRTVEASRDEAVTERDAARMAETMETAAREKAMVGREVAETRYADLLRWSVTYHDSTANSLSWKLTRPLRWLGIGRPKRPGRPPV